MTTIVFLHIPKTAGQTIHHQLARAVGPRHVSPIRTHTQALGQSQLPPGYLLHSGHIDWPDLESLPEDRFVFTVLRDPRERIASFYFYLLKEAQAASAQALEEPEGVNKRTILSRSADDYFFGGDAGWQAFVLDLYDNFYCSYFATRRMRGRGRLAGLEPQDVLSRARAGLALLDGIYWTDNLAALERDTHARAGLRIQVVGRMRNAGSVPLDQPRWPLLMQRFETDAARSAMERFVERDLALLADVPHPAPGPPRRGWRQVLFRNSR